MAFKNSVYKTDNHFSINPRSRLIENQSIAKNLIIQYDHNAERFEFEIPRFVDGRDLSLCDKVEVHYLNIGSASKQNIGLYEVEDLQLSPDNENIVIFSWLISQNATRLVGRLNFLIRFVVVSDDGTLEYAWNTEIYSGIYVSNGIYNADYIVEEYPDILEQWRSRIEALEKGGVGVDGAEKTANKVTNINEKSDDDHYPSAKAVYDLFDGFCASINTVLESIIEGSENTT